MCLSRCGRRRAAAAAARLPAAASWLLLAKAVLLGTADHAVVARRCMPPRMSGNVRHRGAGPALKRSKTTVTLPPRLAVLKWCFYELLLARQPLELAGATAVPPPAAVVQQWCNSCVAAAAVVIALLLPRLRRLSRALIASHARASRRRKDPADI